jgi:hypothetical protein
MSGLILEAVFIVIRELKEGKHVAGIYNSQSRCQGMKVDVPCR